MQQTDHLLCSWWYVLHLFASFNFQALYVENTCLQRGCKWCILEGQFGKWCIPEGSTMELYPFFVLVTLAGLLVLIRFFLKEDECTFDSLAKTVVLTWSCPMINKNMQDQEALHVHKAKAGEFVQWTFHYWIRGVSWLVLFWNSSLWPWSACSPYSGPQCASSPWLQWGLHHGGGSPVQDKVLSIWVHMVSMLLLVV